MLLVARKDYAGNLLLSLLRSQQQLTTVFSDTAATLAYGLRHCVEQCIDLVYGSLSLEFTPPEIGQLADMNNALLVFADTEVSIIDGSFLHEC